MTNETCVAIKELREIPFFGAGDSVESRLRRVCLRGFSDVKIYENARFEIVSLSSDEIVRGLHTPQPSVYQTNLDRVAALHKLFLEQGVNILNLNKGYDFVAVSDDGEETNWTMIPPVVERFAIPSNAGCLDYSGLIGGELAERLHQDGFGLNSEVAKIPHTSESGIFDLVNDGSHRIHFGYLNGGIKLLRISGTKEGYPYYAVPHPYSAVQIFPKVTPETTAMKVHVVQEPEQKKLYRLFPSGGIHSGDVRKATAGEEFN